MWTRHAVVHFGLILGLLGAVSAARAQDFHIDDVNAATAVDIAQIKQKTIVFSDHLGGTSAASEAYLTKFEDWASAHPVQKKFLTLFPGYTEPGPGKVLSSDGTPSSGKLYMYIAQARFIVDRAPASIDLSRYVTLAFLEKIDPAIKHTQIAATDVAPFNADTGYGNDNPDRKWCTGRTTSICLRSVYKMEGKIPIGILLVNKIRDSGRKISDQIDFQSEFSALAPADLDTAGLQQLTALTTPVEGALVQNIFYVNEVMRFGKFLAVFQDHPTDQTKTVATAFMAIGVDAGVLEKKREYENVPVLRNLVPAQVLMGQSSFNAGNSISGGLPKYARNEIAMVAGILEKDAAAK